MTKKQRQTHNALQSHVESRMSRRVKSGSDMLNSVLGARSPSMGECKRLREPGSTTNDNYMEVDDQINQTVF